MKHNSTPGVQEVAVADPKELAARLRAAATGTVEWRVQHPVKKDYCIAFGSTSSLNPERDARRWLEDHRTRFPGGLFVNYEVAQVRYLTELERLALEAADALDACGVQEVDRG